MIKTRTWNLQDTIESYATPSSQQYAAGTNTLFSCTGKYLYLDVVIVQASTSVVSASGDLDCSASGSEVDGSLA